MKSVVEIIMGGERGHIDLTTNRHHRVDYEVGRSGMNKVTGNAIPEWLLNVKPLDR